MSAPTLAAGPAFPATHEWRVRMADQLVHDVAALLNGLGLALDSLGMDSASPLQGLGGEDADALRMARASVHRLSVLVRDYGETRRFLTRHRMVIGPFDLQPVLTQAVAAANLRDRATTHATFTPGFPLVRGDRSLLTQALASFLRSIATVAVDAELPLRIGLACEPARTGNMAHCAVTVATDGGVLSRRRIGQALPSVVLQLVKAMLEAQDGWVEFDADGEFPIRFALPVAGAMLAT